MQYKLLAVSKWPGLANINIGDYIQSLAAAQYYPHVDGFIDRDMELKEYEDEPCKVIMNGWYMHDPKNWPPSERIIPLFVAFHLNILAKEVLLSPPSLSYLRQHAPIGCRDLNTLELLKNNGVEAYFSGCLTLTLGEKYRSETKEDRTYIVDPVYEVHLRGGNILKAVLTLFRHPKDMHALYPKYRTFARPDRGWMDKLLETALYYREYTRVFSREIVVESTYIGHEQAGYRSRFDSDQARLKEAERLIRLYAGARLVVTSRIHCALPCLGLETPVVYLEKAQDAEVSSCRLGGLRDFFNRMKLENGRLIPDFDLPSPITMRNIPLNKDSWRPYAEALKRRCEAFVKADRRV